jgi:hypothetical protein
MYEEIQTERTAQDSSEIAHWGETIPVFSRQVNHYLLHFLLLLLFATTECNSQTCWSE